MKNTCEEKDIQNLYRETWKYKIAWETQCDKIIVLNFILKQWDLKVALE